jgi:hypothetical protein
MSMCATWEEGEKQRRLECGLPQFTGQIGVASSYRHRTHRVLAGWISSISQGLRALDGGGRKHDPHCHDKGCRR